jgi:hypothetical protein
LTTCWLENPKIEVGDPSYVAGENTSSRTTRWYILVVRVPWCPVTSL